MPWLICGGGVVPPVTIRREPHRPASHGSLQGTFLCFFMRPEIALSLFLSALVVVGVVICILCLSSFRLLFFFFSSSCLIPSSPCPVLSCTSYLPPLTILKPRRVDGPVNRNPGSPGAISVSPLVETLNPRCDLVRWCENYPACLITA